MTIYIHPNTLAEAKRAFKHRRSAVATWKKNTPRPVIREIPQKLKRGVPQPPVKVYGRREKFPGFCSFEGESINCVTVVINSISHFRMYIKPGCTYAQFFDQMYNMLPLWAFYEDHNAQIEFWIPTIVSL